MLGEEILYKIGEEEYTELQYGIKPYILIKIKNG